MNKKFLLVLFIAMFYQLSGVCQNKDTITYQGKTLNVPELLDTNKRFYKFEYYMAEARKAFLSKEYEKTVYYVKTAERMDGMQSSAFWFYLGLSKLNLGDEGLCKKYFKIGFLEFGCWECNEANEKIFGEKLEF